MTYARFIESLKCGDAIIIPGASQAAQRGVSILCGDEDQDLSENVISRKTMRGPIAFLTAGKKK